MDGFGVRRSAIDFPSVSTHWGAPTSRVRGLGSVRLSVAEGSRNRHGLRPGVLEDSGNVVFTSMCITFGFNLLLIGYSRVGGSCKGVL